MPGRSDRDAIQAFVTDLGVDAITHVVDTDGTLWQRFEITSQPAVVFITDDGTMSIHNGSIGPEELHTELEELRSR